MSSKDCEARDSKDIKIRIETLGMSWFGSCLWQPDGWHKWWRGFKAKFNPNDFLCS